MDSVTTDLWPRSGSCSGAQSSASLNPELLRRFGITRVGDVTDLDVLGVPVWFATRPNSRGLSVAQGKGLTVEQARVSAIMEAIEGAVAEDTQQHVCDIGSVAEMEERGLNTIPLETLARVDANNLDRHRERAWVRGRSFRSGNDVLAPFELIGLDFRADFPWDRTTFHMSSEGLAAGFDYDKVALHALLELVENDACFLIDAFETRSVMPSPITLKPAANAKLDSLIRHLADRGLRVRFFNLTTSVGIPVVMASLERSLLTSEGPTVRQAAGVACRLTLHDAALAALLEAIQSRLTAISGARDDLSPAHYQRDCMTFTGGSSGNPVETDRQYREISCDNGQPAWQALVEHLYSAGVDDIYLFSLNTGVSGLHVVRALTSGLNATSSGLQQIKSTALERFLVEQGRS